MTEVHDIRTAIDLMDKGSLKVEIKSQFQDPIKLYNLPIKKLFVVTDGGYKSYEDYLAEKNKPQLIQVISTKNTGRDIPLEEAEKPSPIPSPNMKDALKDKREEGW